MVSIFGMKFFESPSMEEQMHYKGRSTRRHRSRRHRHGPYCQCPICNKKRYRKSRRQGVLKGGYVYDKKSGDNEEDVTMELSTSKQEKSRVGKGTKRRRHQ
jgi:hypothetical protein